MPPRVRRVRLRRHHRRLLVLPGVQPQRTVGVATGPDHGRDRPCHRDPVTDRPRHVSTSAQLRAALTNTLAEDGTLTDPVWRGAVEAVPRELFVQAYFAQVPDSVP